MRSRRSLPTCRKCQNHTRIVPVKGHKNVCPYRRCPCMDCKLIGKKRVIMAKEVAYRRSQQAALESGEVHELTVDRAYVCCLCKGNEVMKDVDFLVHLNELHGIVFYVRCSNCNKTFNDLKCCVTHVDNCKDPEEIESA